MNETGNKPGKTSLPQSFSYAFAGIAFALRTQRNARLHLAATAAVAVAGFWLDVSREDWRWLAACIALVWFSEMVNTAFEHLCDVVMPELHASVKNAKDVAAGAVLICAIASVVIGASTFWPYIM